MIDTRHGSIDPSTFVNKDIDKISKGLDDVFILPTRFMRSCRDKGEKPLKIDGRVGQRRRGVEAGLMPQHL